MGVVAKPSQVILLVEDSHHEQFIFRYLRKLDYGTHAMRIVKSPSGAGSAEQWVRERFPIEVEAYRGRQAETKLIVLIDADTRSVRQRILQLDQALLEAGAPPISDNDEGIARLVSKRNIETWILCLNEVQVNEDTDYKRARDNWSEIIRTAAGTLYLWTRQRAPLPSSCVESLRIGIRDLRKVKL
jgi:hypothetical protein